MMYLGDYIAGETVYFMWSSNGSNGASITRATNGTISVYKDGNTTQTTTGVTDTEDFDGLTGIHHVAVATSDAFYTTATDFMVVLSGATIDGQTVNAVLAHFSIENRPLNAAKIASDAITAAKIAADVTTEIQNGLATAASIAALNNLSAAQVNAEVDTALADVGLTTTITGRIDAAVSTRASQASVDTVDDLLDTEVAAVLAAVDTEVAAIKTETDKIASIKTKTDSLTYTISGKVDANITHVIGDAVQENGADDTNWGGTP